MSLNSYYFADKNMRSKMARIHTEKMDMKYGDEIEECITHSIICDSNKDWYNGKTASFTEDTKTNISLIDKGSVEVIFSNKDKANGMCVLNFASYTQPGGMFLKGSCTQEESLCSASFLYNVLTSNRLKHYYDWNNDNKNRGMYFNRAIYSPNVRFFDYQEYDSHSSSFESVTCDVITCACPNWSIAMRYGNFTKEENYEACKSRIEFILSIAASFNVRTFILGAFGCGVFAQDGVEIAKIFKEMLSVKYKDVFENVIFAVPIGEYDTNYSKFESVFNPGNNE